MPKYRVVLQRRALDDLDQAYSNAAKNAPVTAARWVNRFQASLKTLEHNPQRCPLASENRKTNRAELHEYLYGRRPNVFRAIYMIDGDAVRILRIRRASQRHLTRGDIDHALNEADE